MNKHVSRMAGALAAGLVALAAPAYADANLLANGGFEAGDFSGWTESGDTLFNGVQCSGAGHPSVYEGNCSAFFGSFTSVGGIAQTVGLGSVGQVWDLSFALLSDGGEGSSFSAQLGGRTLLSLSDLTSGVYTTYHFSGITTAEAMTLSFSAYSPVGYLSLDAVTATVSAVPEPATMGLLGAGMAALFLARRRTRARVST